ncbi:MAG: tRNA (adenosine(37)-N6)-dimethylallyltransferase MiaA [Bacteroidales bacterium]|nr:tRNA (adenosine(37)-N6)-dimethylallyltransferase MiaA [Bacteroidales bacterium]
MSNRLIIVTGPTASGKTTLAIELAKRLDGEIICVDSRQVYRDIPIGTAAPTPEERASVPHHLCEMLPLEAYYSAAMFEQDVMKLLPEIWGRGKEAIMCGGAMMYVDAVCQGIAPLPTISQDVRARVLNMYKEQGLEGVQRELERLDPASCQTVDMRNPRRVIHAIEICLQAGRPASELRTGAPAAQRHFPIVKMAIDWPREELFARINARVDAMVDQGLVEEARCQFLRYSSTENPSNPLYTQAPNALNIPNSLNTVGFKELFAHFRGEMDYDTAIARIGKNTRVYAKKQLTWLRRDPSIHWLNPHHPLLPQAISLL